MSGCSTYAVVTPARDEADNLPRLAGCLAAQTRRPTSWVIVDNGSADGTAVVAQRLEREHPWVHLVTGDGAERVSRGGPIVRAFETGLAAIGSLPGVVVKLDADVSIAPSYFERLLAAFAAEPALGIASGSAYELEGGAWRQRAISGDNVWGASRAYRTDCLRDVLPLDESMGWDGIDAVKAAMHGWTTRTLPDLPFQHHRREGDRDGARRRGWSARGRASHYMGYRFAYLVLRALYHARREPAAFALVYGYASAALRRERRCPDGDVRAFLRERQRLVTLLLRRHA